MIKPWNVDDVIHQCKKMHWGATDPYVTGWNNWPCKQDLYRVKFYLDELLKSCPTYSVEQEWLDQIEKDKVWNALNQRK